jgi:response regulator RpfG family c-di-GMP phosphodiesterase
MNSENSAIGMGLTALVGAVIAWIRGEKQGRSAVDRIRTLREEFTKEIATLVPREICAERHLRTDETLLRIADQQEKLREEMRVEFREVKQLIKNNGHNAGGPR